MSDYRNRPPVDAPRELRIGRDAALFLILAPLGAALGYLACVAAGLAW